jgi:hypothetical protein
VRVPTKKVLLSLGTALVYLLYELDAGGQVHPEVNELPFDAFLLVLLLLQHEHVMIEKLLQFLIGEVDAQLLQTVELNKWKYKLTFNL